MIILDIVNQAIDQIGIQNVKTLESKETASIMFLSLANKVSNEIAISNKWQALTRFREIKVTAGSDSIILSDIDNFDNVESLSLFNKSDNCRILQCSLDEFLNDKARKITGFKKFVLTEGKMLFNSSFASDTYLLLFYKSDNPIKRLITKDEEEVVQYDKIFKFNDDLFLLNEQLLVQGIVAEYSAKFQVPNWEYEKSEFQRLLNIMSNKDSMNIIVRL